MPPRLIPWNHPPLQLPFLLDAATFFAADSVVVMTRLYEEPQLNQTTSLIGMPNRCAAYFRPESISSLVILFFVFRLGVNSLRRPPPYASRCVCRQKSSTIFHAAFFAATRAHRTSTAARAWSDVLALHLPTPARPPMRPNFAAAEFFFSLVDFIGSRLREPLRMVKEFCVYPVFGYSDDHGELATITVRVGYRDVTSHR